MFQTQRLLNDYLRNRHWHNIIKSVCSFQCAEIAALFTKNFFFFQTFEKPTSVRQSSQMRPQPLVFRSKNSLNVHGQKDHGFSLKNGLRKGVFTTLPVEDTNSNIKEILKSLHRSRTGPTFQWPIVPSVLQQRKTFDFIDAERQTLANLKVGNTIPIYIV